MPKLVESLTQISKPLRAEQIRILQALARGKEIEKGYGAHKRKTTVFTLTRAELADLACNGHLGRAFNAIGPTEPDKWAVTEERTKFPCLMSLGYINTTVIGGSGEEVNDRVYWITDSGREALKKGGAQ